MVLESLVVAVNLLFYVLSEMKRKENLLIAKGEAGNVLRRTQVFYLVSLTGFGLKENSYVCYNIVFTPQAITWNEV